MPLQKQIFELPMTGSLDESVAPETGDPTAWSAVSNFRQDQRGAYSKRMGSSVWTRTTVANLQVSSARKIAMLGEVNPVVFGQDSGAVDGNKLYSYSNEVGRWIERDRVPEALVTRTAGIQPGSNFYPLYEIGGYGNYRVIAFSTYSSTGTNGYLNVAIMDVTTGAVVRGPEVLDTSTTQQFVVHSVCVIGSTACVVYNISDGKIYLRTISLSSAANITTGWAARVQLMTGLGLMFDVCSMSDRFFVAYTDAGFTNVFVSSYDTTGSILATTPPVAGAWPYAAIAVKESDTLWMAYQNNGAAAVNLIGYSPTALTVTGTTVALFNRPGAAWGASSALTIVPTTTARCIVAESEFSSTSPFICIRPAVISAGACGNDGALRTVYRCSIVGKGFRVNGRNYMTIVPGPITTSTTRPACAYVVDMGDAGTTFRPLSNVAPNLTGDLSKAPMFVFPRTPYVYSTTKVDMIHPTQRSGGVISYDLVTLDFGASNRWQAAEIANALHTGSGVASYFDGARVHEQNFLMPPEIGTIASGTAGALTGTYSYTAIYEHVDAAGNVHWSEPAATKSSGAVVAKRVDVPVATLPVTTRMDSDDSTNPVRIVLFRTKDSLSTYYRVAQQDNIVSAVSVTFQDNTLDATISVNPQLYTQPSTPGTTLPRRAPPSLTCIIQHNDGLAAVAEDGTTLWFSGQRIPGEGIWWNPLLTQVIEDEGRVVALASFDGRLYAFTRRSVWVIDGNGYTDNGGGGYSIPKKLSSECGCIEPRSVVVCSAGALFQSDRGIMLLSRSGDVTWHGEPAQSTLSSFPIITGAVVNHRENYVKFACVASESSTGVSGQGVWICWDYASNTWFTSRAAQPSGGDGTAPAVQAQTIGVVGSYGVALWSDSLGAVYRDEPTSWLDNWDSSYGYSAAPALGYITTNWIHLAGLEGFQRVWRILVLMKRYEDHQVDVTAWFDYDDSVSAYTETWSYTYTEIAALPREQLELMLKKQKCQAIKLKISVSNAGSVTTGRQCDILGIRFEYGIRSKTTLSTAHR